jgi:uncharacterized protein
VIGRLHTREDSGLRLDRQLRWWHDGLLVEHPNIIRAFNTGLEPTDDGRFLLRFGRDWCYVEVEDAAYAVTGVDLTHDQAAFSVRLSDLTEEPLDAATIRIEDGVLTCRVKQGRAKARFSRDAQFALGQHLEPDGASVILHAGAVEIPVPNLDPSAFTSPST